MFGFYVLPQIISTKSSFFAETNIFCIWSKFEVKYFQYCKETGSFKDKKNLPFTLDFLFIQKLVQIIAH
jgi:hypothetical protein